MELSSVERQVSAALAAVEAMYDTLRSNLSGLRSQVDECLELVGAMDQASFGFQPGEAGVAVVKAKWLKDGRKEGPKGVLFLTDKRLVYEQREKVATRKLLFITTASEEVKELLWEAPIGALVNFAAHPVIMGSKNLLFSSEYPGHAMAALERVLGPEVVCLFANGACGNITIRRRGPSFAEVERLGGMLAGHALRALGSAETSEEVRIGASCASVPLGLRTLPSVEKAREELEALRKVKPRDAAEASGIKRKISKAAGTASLAEKAEYIRASLGEELTTHLQILELNDAVLVGVPAELFAEYGLALKKQLGPGRTMVVGYCNDMVGYVVTPEAFEEGGYEAGATLLDTEAGQRMVDAATRMGCRKT
jgi:hypothetical protein